jgi:hypothetical protein
LVLKHTDRPATDWRASLTYQRLSADQFAQVFGQSKTLKYSIEAFATTTGLLEFEIALPDGCDASLPKIMGWSSPQRGDEGYDLDATQIAALESLANKAFYGQDHVFQLTCNAD